MASTFFGLNIAGSGLRAANAAINTAANNIANADTKGYSRQQVIQQAADPLRAFATYGCAGAGVQTLAIERIRDEFYDVKYRENETSYGEYSAKNYYMQLIQDYFDDDGTTGFSSIFTNMKAVGTQEVLKNPGDATSKKDFMGTVEKLVEYFNTSAKNLERLQKDINDEIKVKVETINSIAKEIQTLNKQINVIELSGSKANELRDKRDLLVDQLSGIVDVEVIENPVYDTNDPDRETGATRYMVRIAGGQPLVDDNKRYELECRARESNNKVNQSDITGLYDIYWVGGDMFNTTNSRMGGELAGLLKLRDGNNSEYFYGKVGQTQLVDGKMQVTIDVTADYLKDLNKCTLASAGTINIGNTLYRYDGWTFERDADGNCSYTITLAEGQTFTSMLGKSASVGSGIDYQGIPYYQEQMNEWVRIFAKAMNDILKSGYTDDGEPGCQMFTYDYVDAAGMAEGKFGDGAVLFSGSDGAGTVSNLDDSYYRLTAGNLTLFDALKANAELLGVKTDPNQTDGESQYDNMTLLLDTMTDEKKLSFRSTDAGQFLTCVLGDITLAAGSAETFEENYEVLRRTLDNQRLSISGVDEDEEALSVVHLQDSYTLACKMISTFSEIYDRLILETGV
ncbi:MAG: flagellar hook-associated protein FlgK [Lachnospiraceae bacterium]|nr:flagellar hook-associated protein FlgK [Lachnospiraceae bacterium]